MNNTKWSEIFKAFYYGYECAQDETLRSIRFPWTTRSVDGYVYSDNTWTHFGVGMENSKEIDWLKIELTPENREFVLELLRKIHVPGEVQENCVIVYGHRMDVDYIG